MSDEQSWLARGASSLTLMVMGFDQELDSQLKKLRKVLREKDLRQEEFNEVMSAVETLYDELEADQEKSISTYKNAFEVILDGQHTNILEPLMQEQPLLSDLLKVAEPLARHVNTLSKSDTSIASEELEQLRSRLEKRFKALIQTLMLMGDDNGSFNHLDALLKNNPSWDDLDSLAAQTVDLLKVRLSEEKKQFEVYLSELNQKLTKINKIVEADSATLSELKEINIEFNSSINQQMTEARQKIDDHEKMDILKSDLLLSLDSITQRLEEYQSTYGNKLQALQNNKEQMTMHVQDLERENLELQSELVKERKLSMMDTLTQLPNRQGFNSRLEEELSRAKRYNHYLSIAILDIDFF